MNQRFENEFYNKKVTKLCKINVFEKIQRAMIVLCTFIFKALYYNFHLKIITFLMFIEDHSICRFACPVLL